jgi:hypothetical protein
MKSNARAIAPLLFFIALSAGAASNPLRVPITELMTHPQQFYEKRVSFIGYYDSGDGHGTSVRVSPSDSGPRIFLDFKHTTLPLKPLQRIPSGSYVRVTGTFIPADDFRVRQGR